MSKRLLVVLALLLSACVSAGGPKNNPGSKAVVAVAISPDAQLEAAELRQALADAYKIIETRASTAPVIVDADAALSIAIPEHRTVSGAIDYFSTRLKPSIQTSLTRSSRYHTMITKVLDEKKLPRGLAYLPVIESAYIPTLTSKAGAHGIWQFMPDTAREHGLRVDWWVDERANPEKSTRAAATYLASLYREFGDWSLALAAYNCGQGRVRRTLRETGASTFWELLDQSALPKETRGYVPTFFATLVIVSDPATYGFKLEEPREEVVEAVSIQGPVTLAHIASRIGADEKLLKDFNPEFRRGVLPPGTSRLKVPTTYVAELRANADRFRFEDEQLPVATFTARKGDSLDTLAKLVGVAKGDLQLMNDRRGDVRNGESIYLPVSEQKLARLLQQERERPSLKYHLVKKGETLYSIAKKHDLTIEELSDLNELKESRKLKPGERLRVNVTQALTAGGM